MSDDVTSWNLQTLKKEKAKLLNLFFTDAFSLRRVYFSHHQTPGLAPPPPAEGAVPLVRLMTPTFQVMT